MPATEPRANRLRRTPSRNAHGTSRNATRKSAPKMYPMLGAIASRTLPSRSTTSVSVPARYTGSSTRLAGTVAARQRRASTTTAEPMSPTVNTVATTSTIPARRAESCTTIALSGQSDAQP